MGEDDLSSKQERLQQSLKDCAGMEAQLARAEQQLQKMEDGIAKREIRLRQLLQQEEDDRAASGSPSGN